MKAETTNSNTNHTTPDLQLSKAEKSAYQHVRKLKRFYTDLLIFAVVMAFLVIVNWLTSPYWWVMWVFLGWGLSFVIRAARLFLPFSLFDADWEKFQVNNHLQRKPNNRS